LFDPNAVQHQHLSTCFLYQQQNVLFWK
jgi:hypothetical protein